MSTIIGVNLNIVFNEDTPLEILVWLEANNSVIMYSEEDFGKLVPTYIKENSPRCIELKDFTSVVSEYEFYKDEKRLTMYGEHKNIDNDWEHTINYFIPYIDKDKSSGFIGNDIVHAITFNPVEDKSSLDKVLIKSVCDRNDCPEIIEIVDDIWNLNRYYKEQLEREQ